jgi:signal transduction histidine kinase
VIRTQEEERRRIARELHEEIAQTLAAAQITEMLAVDGSGGPDAKNLGLLRRTIDQIRDLTLDLRPATLDDFGIVEAIRSHLAAVSLRTGLALRLDADPGIGRLLPELETACFRVAQEAVANAVRHAQAREVRVRLRHAGRKLTLTVADDGRGFDLAAAAGPGFGIPLMRERAALAGGRLRVLSNPGEGTVVRMILPTSPVALDPAGVGA